MIDITFDFRSDSKGKDPDAYSPTLEQGTSKWRGHGTSIREGSLCLQMEGFLVLE